VVVKESHLRDDNEEPFAIDDDRAAKIAAAGRRAAKRRQP